MQLLLQKEPIIVSELAGSLGLGHSLLSKHLAILRGADLVLTKRKSVFIYYSVNRPQLERLRRVVEAISGKQ